MKTIVIAGGCFWGVQAYYAQLDGVLETEVGYANGKTENPTYEDVCSHLTGHAEVVKVKYDPEIISLEDLLERFFRIVDPTAWNRQGPDIGDQYRNGIYFTHPEDQALINAYIDKQKPKYSDLIVTEVEPLKAYYKAEEYHQDYLKKNPNGYCHINLNA
ncbi:peptide-methionine (S)-S-oxide reductase MsrA [Fusibacter sp. JL216-2]|uniref:peptide-methionine (S)-S-oxide reductase MsrA n=1 Tax=Fusibacter sp. JL216-2 TaxID=3071453 RepID=UPI003D35911F